MSNRIPKIFHYCWFGKKPLSKVAEMCIESWKNVHPDFEVVRWDEGNTDLNTPYLQAAYVSKKWAFVSDAVRFSVLNNLGGVYMDVDMLLLKPLDVLLKFEGFIGFEDHKYVSAGIIGCTANNALVAELNSQYQNATFNPEKPVLINSMLNRQFVANGLTQFNQKQNLSGFEMLTSEVFYPFSFVQAQTDKDFSKYVTEKSLAVHLWDHSWGDEFSEFRKGNTIKGIQKAAAKVIRNPNQPLGYYKKVAKNVLRSRDKRDLK